MSSVSVVIGDRHPVFLCGLNSVLRGETDFSVVASCRDGSECLHAIRNLAPDIALLDVAMPGVSGFDILAAAAAERLCTRVLLLAASTEPRERSAATARGAYGVVSRAARPDIIIHCLRQVANGKRMCPVRSWGSVSRREPLSQHEDGENAFARLTEREREIVRLVAEGLSNKEMGSRLDLSEGTVKVHLHNIFQKLAIHNRTTLAAKAVSSQ